MKLNKLLPTPIYLYQRQFFQIGCSFKTTNTTCTTNTTFYTKNGGTLSDTTTHTIIIYSNEDLFPSQIIVSAVIPR